MNKSLFQEAYQTTPMSLILEYALEGRELDFALSDAVEGTGMNLREASDALRSLLRRKILKPTRMHEGEQLYQLNSESEIAQFWVRAFDAVLADGMEIFKRKGYVAIQEETQITAE